MDISFTPLKSFAVTRPVLYGAPLAAVAGLVLGLLFRVGAQLEAPAYSTPVNLAALEDTPAPITWPSGKVPDYVIGTDFIATAQPPRPIVADYRDEEPFVMPPPMDVPPPLVRAARTAPVEPHWASIDGDILNTRLPEDPPADDPTRD